PTSQVRPEQEFVQLRSDRLFLPRELLCQGPVVRVLLSKEAQAELGGERMVEWVVLQVIWVQMETLAPCDFVCVSSSEAPRVAGMVVYPLVHLSSIQFRRLGQPHDPRSQISTLYVHTVDSVYSPLLSLPFVSCDVPSWLLSSAL
ncbi:unnamed protein product, partial [Rhizoctonia solani]